MCKFKRNFILLSGGIAVALITGTTRPALAQGNDTTTQTTTPGSVRSGVLVGAGTSDETTSGSSGPRQATAQQELEPKIQAGTQPGPNGLFCADIRDETARRACDAKKGKQP